MDRFYKTRMCRHFPRCPYGVNCKFSHGSADFRKEGPVPLSPSKYKTKRCKYYIEKTVCPYYPRCLFRHGEERSKEYVCPLYHFTGWCFYEEGGCPLSHDRRSHCPKVKWAQGLDELYITVELCNASNVKIRLDPVGKFSFSATSGAEKIPYEVDMDLYDKVDAEDYEVNIQPTNISYIVKKAEKKLWNRLLKQEGELGYLKVDLEKGVNAEQDG